MLCLLTEPQELQLTSKKPHPELPENQTVWKSDHQGFKEATFIQTGRRDGVTETGGDMVWHGEAVAVEKAIPHSCVVDKNEEEYLGSKQSSPRPDLTAQVSCAGKIKPQNLWL